MILLHIPENESIKSDTGTELNGPLTLEIDENNKVVFKWGNKLTVVSKPIN